MFGFGAFVIGAVVQEFCRGAAARRAMTHEPPPVALVQLVRRNRRRYGGYIVHAGLAVLLIGVAASSSFQHSQRRHAGARARASIVDGYTITYVRPTGSRRPPQKISFGAVLDVTKGGKHVTTLHDDARLLSVAGPDARDHRPLLQRRAGQQRSASSRDHRRTSGR